jgi:phage-related protein
MRSAASDLMTGLLNGIRERATDAVNRVREMATDLVSTVRGFIDRMKSAATALINGLIRGIADGAGRVVERMRQLARDALNAAKRIFGINSPSREFAKIGVGICDGLVIGLNDGMSKVIKAVCNISDAMTDAFDVSATTSLTAASYGIGTSYGARATGTAFAAAGTSGNTYLTFNTPVTGYHDVLAAQRTAQRQAGRR